MQQTTPVKTQVKPGTVRIVEVPVTKEPMFFWESAFSHIQQGAWAVALTVGFLWVSTAGIRRRVGESLTDYFTQQVSLLETVKETTTSNATALTAIEARSQYYRDKFQDIEGEVHEILEIVQDIKKVTTS